MKTYRSREHGKVLLDRILYLWSIGCTSGEITERVGLKSRGNVMNRIIDARERGDPRAIKGRPERRRERLGEGA